MWRTVGPVDPVLLLKGLVPACLLQSGNYCCYCLVSEGPGLFVLVGDEGLYVFII